MPPRELTPATLANDLLREYPDEIPPEVIRERAETAGFKPETIARLVARFSEPLPAPEPLRVRTVNVAALRVVDLSGLDSVRTRIKGSGYCVTDAGRKLYGGTEYLLIPEPDNPIDPSAVAVYGKGRRVGYLSTARAGTIAPILTRLGADGYRVTGTGTTPNSVVLWVDVPKVAGLRKFARTHSQSS
ncbi:MAG: hypothetical protein IT193_16720 [Propionibacteriaceae bacterium]|nr:hypothetical protein [Propionibacteriaceae bacterium]